MDLNIRESELVYRRSDQQQEEPRARRQRLRKNGTTQDWQSVTREKRWQRVGAYDGGDEVLAEQHDSQELLHRHILLLNGDGEDRHAGRHRTLRQQHEPLREVGLERRRDAAVVDQEQAGDVQQRQGNPPHQQSWDGKHRVSQQPS